jgi:hypothetical protein
MQAMERSEKAESPDDAERTAVLNGFGRTLGDGVMGLQALTIAIDRGAVSRLPVLFRLPGLAPVLQQLYDAAEFAEIRELPWADETPARPFPAARSFARTVDIRDFAFDPDFRGRAMIDYFLAKLGVDPETVASSLKRNSWLKPRVRPLPPDGMAKGYTLLCPRSANEMRTMPAAIQSAIMEWLAKYTDRPVLTLAHADSLDILCGRVASAGHVISTDTATVHLADAFSVPCLAFFTTHRPEWRARDYPFCRGVHLPVAGFPPALEFARDASDIAAAQAAWFPGDDDLAWLRAELNAAFSGL